MSHFDANARRLHNGVLAPGTVLGRYEILRLISVGGMAEIYLARAEGIAGFEKRVVIKRMLPHFSAQASYVDMFLAEARLAATLDHPNIAQVHDIGESTGDYYYAMEYVAGVDLREIVHAERAAGRRVPIPMVTAIGRGLCAGLDHAHSRTGPDGRLLGVVHRDVSLSNVLVSYDGTVKIIDFGVAKIGTAAAQTRAGLLKGKIGYMSPEQCKGETLDRRSDVFAIGIALWELTCGQRLFSGDGEFAILKAIVDGTIKSPSSLRPELPAQLESIILRALHRDRNQRYQTARDVQRDLETFARDERLAVADIELGEYMSELFPIDRRVSAIYQSPMGFDGDMGVAMATESIAEGDDELSVDLEIVDEPVVHLRGAAASGHLRPGAVAASVTPRGLATMAPSTTDLRPRRPQLRRELAIGGGVASLALCVWLWSTGSNHKHQLVAAEHPAPLPSASLLSAPTLATPRQAPAATAPAPAPARVAARQVTPAPIDEDLVPDAPTDVGDRPAAASSVAARDGERGRGGAAEPQKTRRGPADKVATREIAQAPAHGVRGVPAPSIDAGAVETAPAAPVPPSGDDALPPRGATAMVPTSTTAQSATLPSPAPEAPTPRPRPTPAKPAQDTPGSLDATASIGAVAVDGGLQTSVVRRGAERALAGYRDCYRTAARSAQRTPSTTVKISFEIDENGLVHNPQAQSAALPALGACLQDVTRRIRSQIAPDVGVARASVVVTFQPTAP